MLEVDISPINKNHVRTLRDQISSLKKTSNLSMKDYLLKYKGLMHRICYEWWSGYGVYKKGLGPEFRMFRTSLNQSFKEDIVMKE